MGIIEQLPSELLVTIADLLDIRAFAALRICCKLLSKNAMLGDLKQLCIKMNEALHSPIHGTQLFYVEGSLRNTAMRAVEYDEMEKRLPSSMRIVTPPYVNITFSSRNFKLYQMWKESNAYFCDNASATRNQATFNYFYSHKEELQRVAMQTWGYNMSQSMFNFLMFWDATFFHGLDSYMHSVGLPIGILKWLLRDRDKELEFQEIAGKPFDIRLHDPSNAIPELVTVLKVLPDGERYHLRYDHPDMPTCVYGDGAEYRTLLEYYCAKLLDYVIANIYDHSIKYSSDEEIEKRSFLWKRMYIIEQIFQFERVLGVSAFGPLLFTYGRMRLFNPSTK